LFKSEKGNALIFILIAIALLGLLTVTLSRSGDSTNDSGDYEQNQIAASEILSYAKSIENAVQMLLARGCSENDISFENNVVAGYTNPNAPTDNSCHVFDVAGAGMTYQSTPIFTGAYQITDVGTTRAELLLLLEDQNSLICAQVIALSGTPSIDENYNTPAQFVGIYDNTNAIGDPGETEGVEAGCFTNTNDNSSIMYLVLHAR
jgi:hypothetical protein